MDKNLIVVRQLPVIEDQLRSVQQNVEAYVADILSLDCNEDTYKTVKKARSELNAKFRELEDRRKEVKKQIEEPYKKFEHVYNHCVGDIFTKADKELASKINAVESGLKAQKEEAVRKFFDEYREAMCVPVEFATFERAKITITLSAREKSLNEQSKRFIDQIAEDIKMFNTMEDKDELLFEYQKTLNAAQAITTVNIRKAAIERQRKEREARKQAEAHQAAAVAKVEEYVEPAEVLESAEPETFAPPVAVEVPTPSESQLVCCFRVTAPLSKLKALKKFLDEGGYTYADIPNPG